jgi:NADH-quinone oxidoreductase subunit J
MLMEFLSIVFIILLFASIIHESIFFSIFFLIALFFCSSFIFILLGFEFIGFLYLIVYVGAVAVLFLFMVMLFDKSEYLFFSTQSHLNLEDKIVYQICGFLFASYYAFILFLFLNTSHIDMDFSYLDENNLLFLNNATNLQSLGFLLYNYFYIALIGAALILLIGMIGAIVLTQRFFFIDSSSKHKHQDIKQQLFRQRISK